jgi:type IV pilus assembly protein PilM
MSIGLDIGSSSVKAAELTVQGTRSEVTRFAQVGLSPGAVVEGEVRDRAAVGAAIKRLWAEGGFRSREVVLGISSQRSMVRQVEMPKMRPEELRSALRYDIGDLLPIPVEQAVFDFVTLGPGNPGGDGGETAQVLLVVAQREILLDHIAAAKRAGLKVRAVDSSPLALLRAVPPKGGRVEAVVSLGAQLVVVAVRDGDVPRFVRTVTLPAENVTEPARESVAAGAGGQRAPRRPGPEGTPNRAEVIVEEVRGSLEYFLSHAQGVQVQEILLTGGGALAEDVAPRLTHALGLPVSEAVVGAHYSASQLGLSEEDLERASHYWATAVGLALWGTGSAPAPSLVPAEVRERQQFQRAMAASAVGLLVVAAGLGAVSLGRVHEASRVANQTKADNAEAATLQSRISVLQPASAVQSEVVSRLGLAKEALSGDVDWVGLQRRIVAALPRGVEVTSVSYTRSTANSATGAPAGSGAAPAVPADDVGQISMSLTTSGGPASVAEFVRSESAVPGVYALWVSSTAAPSSGSGGQTTFQATAQVTAAAESKRAAKLPGAGR